MGKARSSRRMRNCKSRTKRGGGFRFFISPEKLKFKQAKEAGNKNDLHNYIVEIVNKTPDEIPLLYDDLNQYDKDILRRCIIDGVKTEEILKDNIRDLSTDLSNTKNEIIETAAQEKNEEQQRQNQEVPSTGLAAEYTAPQRPLDSPTTHATRLRPLIGDNDQHIHDTPPLKPGGFITPKSGGKSSRRHRRVRTLHKRRKSSKVRKTRYRRTHSRTRR